MSIQYVVVRTSDYQNSNVNELVAEINTKYIPDGWEPQGGICVDGDENGSFFYQAMIRKSENIKITCPEVLGYAVDEVGFTERLKNNLKRAGFENVGKVIGKTEVDLLRVEGMGKRSLNELKDFIALHGLYDYSFLKGRNRVD